MYNASKQQLFGVIRTIKVIVMLGLIAINLPGRVLTFLKETIKMAMIDILDPWPYLEPYVAVRETDPYNQNFEYLGIGDKNFLLNSGSFFTVLVAITVSHLIGIMIQRFT